MGKGAQRENLGAIQAGEKVKLKLSLAIRKDGKVVASEVLTEIYKCWNRIVPKREPFLTEDGYRVWVIAPEKRRAFAKAVDRTLSAYNKSFDGGNEEVLGFFTLVGLGTRWGNDKTVDWLLVIGEKKPEEGETLCEKMGGST